jgi:hypothetical protein
MYLSADRKALPKIAHQSTQGKMVIVGCRPAPKAALICIATLFRHFQWQLNEKRIRWFPAATGRALICEKASIFIVTSYVCDFIAKNEFG